MKGDLGRHWLSGLGVDHCFVSKPKEMWMLPSWFEKGELQEQICTEKNQSPCFLYRTNTEQAVRVESAFAL